MELQENRNTEQHYSQNVTFSKEASVLPTPSQQTQNLPSQLKNALEQLTQIQDFDSLDSVVFDTSPTVPNLLNIQQEEHIKDQEIFHKNTSHQQVKHEKNCTSQTIEPTKTTLQTPQSNEK